MTSQMREIVATQLGTLMLQILERNIQLSELEQTVQQAHRAAEDQARVFRQTIEDLQRRLDSLQAVPLPEAEPQIELPDDGLASINLSMEG